MKHFSSLVVLVHGIDSPLLTKDTLSNLRICLLQQAGLRDCFIFQSRVNQGRTQDGIANLASRLVFEIEECCRENGLPKTELRISFIGHSLGGLVCRYAISMMSEEFEKVESVCLFVVLFVCLFVVLFVFLFVCLFVLFVLFVCLFDCLCLFVCLR